MEIDILGRLFNNDAVYDEQGEMVTRPTEVAGYHVNLPQPFEPWAAYLVDPTTPRRVFASGQTYCYTFSGKVEFEAQYTESVAEQIESIEPLPPVPQKVTMRQARLALFSLGLLDSVDAALDLLPEPDKKKALIEWNFSNEALRNNALINGLAAGLNLTSEQIDSLFIEAAKL